MNRAAALLVAGLFLGIPAVAHADTQPTPGLFGGLLLPLSAADLAGLASGGPLVLTHYEATEGAVADGTVTTGPDGQVAIRSHSAASATLTGSPVHLKGAAAVSTGGFAGDVTMENSAGIASLQLASGFNTVQQSAVSFAFVVTGLPAF